MSKSRRTHSIALVVGPHPTHDGSLERRMALAAAWSLGIRGHSVKVVWSNHEASPMQSVRVELRGGLSIRAVAQGPAGQFVSEWWREATGGADVIHLFPSGGDSGGLCQALAGTAPVVLSLPTWVEPEEAYWQTECDAAWRVNFPSRNLLVRFANQLTLDPGRTELLRPMPTSESFRPRGAAPVRWTGEGPLRILYHPVGDSGAPQGGDPGQREGEIAMMNAALQSLPDRRVQLVAAGSGAGDGARSLGRSRHAPGGGFSICQRSGSRLAQLARTCHVAAFPGSTDSGYPWEIEEAFALGLPVMASACNAALEFYGQGPIQELSADAPTWHAAIAEHLSDPKLLQSAQAALPEDWHGAQATVDRWHQLYGLAVSQRAA